MNCSAVKIAWNASIFDQKQESKAQSSKQGASVNRYAQIKNDCFGFIITLLRKMSSQPSRNEVSVAVDSQIEEEGQKRGSGYVPGERSGKWSDQEHMKYIVFIDYNKEKMRSKEKRRSNKFYEEMSNFIATRNALQCRSHHQKLEEKYTHVNKIIALYKNYFNKNMYKQQMEHLDARAQEKIVQHVTRHTMNEKIMVDAEVQTDIKDITCEFRMINPTLVVVQKKRGAESQSHPSMVPAPIYYPPPLLRPMEMVPGMMAPPSYAMPPYGWWGGYAPARL